MKIIVVRTLVALLLASIACSVSVDGPDDGLRSGELDSPWPCEPNCPDPGGECFGECIGGGYCDAPECCVDPDDCVCYAPDSYVSLALCPPLTSPCEDCFGECIGGGYCDGPACCVDPDDCLCYDADAPISQILCGDASGGTSCFGECVGGAYCDDPDCCIDPDNCVCYAPDHPISKLLCECRPDPWSVHQIYD